MAVIVAGGANMDVVAYAERHPRPGETLHGHDLSLGPGGKAANQAIAAAKLGAPTRLIAKIGFDEFGKEIERNLRQEGVDLSLLTRTADAPSGVALIVVAASGENTIVVVSGANALLSAEDVESVEIERSDVLVGQTEVSPEAILRFFHRGKEKEALTVLNMAPIKPHPPELLELTDILVVNETELDLLLRMRGIENGLGQGFSADQALRAAEECRLPGQRAVAVTLGGNGAIAASREGSIIVPGRKVEAVDTTGAGDCFVGALAARLSANQSLEAAMIVANTAAAICVERPGTGAAMPHLHEVELLLD